MTYSLDEAITFLFTDIKVVNALQKEYENYLALCRPLMKIFTASENSAYLTLLTNFEKNLGANIYKTKHLSSISMPERVLKSILKRNPRLDEEQLLAFHKMRTEYLKKNLIQHSVMEIFAIPSLDSVQQEKIKIDLSNTLDLDTREFYYTKEEYLMHLENVLHLLKKYDNYQVCIEKIENDLGYTLYAKENTGVIVSKNIQPLVFLSIKENNLTICFWDFLIELCNQNKLSKKTAISILESTIKENDRKTREEIVEKLEKN